MNAGEIEVDINEAYRYMGCRGDIDEDTKLGLIRASELIKENINPRIVKKICSLDRSDCLRLKGTCLALEGKAISALLHDCDSCVIFCATIGNDIDFLVRKWEIKDISFAAMLDACASCAVENLCDKLENEILEEYAVKGLYLSDRFSPGYGDLPITIQKDFCAVLDTSRRIGVSVSDSGIMIPRKSVTAISGISDKPQKHRSDGCIDCVMTNNCRFRENGVTCFGQAV